MDSSFPILFIGDAERQEVRDAAQWLAGRGARMTDGVSTALDLIWREDFAPAIIVLAEHCPDRQTQGQLHRLRRAAPLARIVRLLGPWFEGEIRTGPSLPAAVRVYWHQWSTGLERVLHPAGNGDGCVWSLPVTAGDDQRLMDTSDVCELGSSLNGQVVAPLIAVYSRHRETAQTLCDVCTQRGWKALWLRNPPSATPLVVDAVLFDSARGSPAELVVLAALKAGTQGAPLVVLQGFPRLDDVARWQSVGAAAVVAKPFLVDELVWQIEQFLPQAASTNV